MQERRSCSRPPYENKRIRCLSSKILCLQSLRFELGQAVRNGEPISALQSAKTLTPETSRCLSELQILDPSLVLTDSSLEMLKQLHSAIQNLIMATKQVSRSLEERLMDQFNTGMARFYEEQRIQQALALLIASCVSRPHRGG